MVDIHSHILPGLDDGAKSLEESLSMVRMAAESGTTDIVASPHANQRYRYEPAAVAAKIAELQQACGDIIKIHRGCDFHLSFENIEDALRDPRKYSINGGSYLLVEFSDMAIPPNTSRLFDQMLSTGLIPIITHPERNPILQANIPMVAGWVRQECLVQVTAGSFLGFFGKAARKSAEELMAKGLVHVVASDAHNTSSRTPDLSQSYQQVAKHYSVKHAEALFKFFPRAILSGDLVDADYLWGAQRKTRRGPFGLW